MQTLKFDTREEWLAARRGKITGTRLKDIVVKRGTGKKIGFYELIAERLALPPDGENPLERGTRLEEEAITAFEKQTGRTVDRSLVIWTRDEDSDVAVSPDGILDDGKEAVECKCLASARHIEALLNDSIPDEYELQVLQYFIVNDGLQVLHFCFYDPRLEVHPFFVKRITRESVLGKIEEMLLFERDTLREVDHLVNKLKGSA